MIPTKTPRKAVPANNLRKATAFKPGTTLDVLGRRHLADFRLAYIFHEDAVYFLDRGILYCEPVRADSRQGFDVLGCEADERVSDFRFCLENRSAGLSLSPTAHDAVALVFGSYAVREAGVFVWMWTGPEVIRGEIERLDVDPATGRLLARRSATVEEQRDFCCFLHAPR